MRVLVVYKRSTLERFFADRDPHVSALLHGGDASVARLRSAHEAHYDTLARTREVLARHGVKAVFRHHHERDDERWDLVVTLGGDGTLLWASHTVDSETPMVAINSAPETSVGYFCAGDRASVDETLRAALAGTLRRMRLARMEVEVDGEVVTRRILNDVLFCHACPAATTRYLIRYGEQTESHTSSGIWIGPAAGSTAAQRSAGGKVLRLGSQKLQWVVREPYLPDAIRSGVRQAEARLLKGLVIAGEALWMKTKIRQGRIFLDGASKVVEVDVGAELVMRRSEEPLTLLGLRSLRAPA